MSRDFVAEGLFLTSYRDEISGKRIGGGKRTPSTRGGELHFKAAKAFFNGSVEEPEGCFSRGRVSSS